jgi:hypothetical protein
MQHLRPATAKEYTVWLKEYQKVHRWPKTQPGSAGRIFVAKSDFELPALYGANSVEIIVPSNIRVKHDNNIGHCKLYFMNGEICPADATIYSEM